MGARMTALAPASLECSFSLPQMPTTVAYDRASSMKLRQVSAYASMNPCVVV